MDGNTSVQRAEKPGRHVVRIIAIVFSYMLMLIGALALVYAGYAINEGRRYQESAARAFETLRAASASTETRAVPSPALPAPSAADVSNEPAMPDAVVVAALKESLPTSGDVIGRLEVPRIRLSVMLAEGDSNAVLRHAVGHLSETSLPGESGNVVFAGHRDTYFRPLRNIRVGDVITIETVDRSYEYKVEWFRVMPPDNVSVLAPSESNELTLITCFPFNLVGPAPDRFVVRARQIMADHVPGAE
ncbi:MAG TPA: class D sortase [Candidatus Acidoferrales bacterium]|nr:class D sortase [Candidatus Acidoferrales bacterium]